MTLYSLMIGKFILQHDVMVHTYTAKYVETIVLILAHIFYDMFYHLPANHNGSAPFMRLSMISFNTPHHLSMPLPKQIPPLTHTPRLEEERRDM